jgi:putative FmdB family regulatory protein
MPLYEFVCDACGPFEHVRPASESADPMRCPTCGADARRVFGGVHTARLSATTRSAHARNERAAHEPPRITRDEIPTTGQPRHSHGPSRPWQIGH